MSLLLGYRLDSAVVSSVYFIIFNVKMCYFCLNRKRAWLQLKLWFSCSNKRGFLNEIFPPFLSEDMLEKKFNTTGNRCDFITFQELCVGTSKVRFRMSEHNQMQDH